MSSIGTRCHELRVDDVKNKREWRLVYRLDSDAIVIGAVFSKTSRTTPTRVIEACQGRFARYDKDGGSK
jgi:phage-related protein